RTSLLSVLARIGSRDEISSACASRASACNIDERRSLLSRDRRLETMGASNRTRARRSRISNQCRSDSLLLQPIQLCESLLRSRHDGEVFKREVQLLSILRVHQQIHPRQRQNLSDQRKQSNFLSGSRQFQRLRIRSLHHIPYSRRIP